MTRRCNESQVAHLNLAAADQGLIIIPRMGESCGTREAAAVPVRRTYSRGKGARVLTLRKITPYEAAAKGMELRGTGAFARGPPGDG